jgi:hypothetical protein
MIVNRLVLPDGRCVRRDGTIEPGPARSEDDHWVEIVTNRWQAVTWVTDLRAVGVDVDRLVGGIGTEIAGALLDLVETPVG